MKSALFRHPGHVVAFSVAVAATVVIANNATALANTWQFTAHAIACQKILGNGSLVRSSSGISNSNATASAYLGLVCPFEESSNRLDTADRIVADVYDGNDDAGGAGKVSVQACFVNAASTGVKCTALVSSPAANTGYYELSVLRSAFYEDLYAHVPGVWSAKYLYVKLPDADLSQSNVRGYGVGTNDLVLFP